MHLIVEPTGRVRAIYGEALDLAALGRPVITRASQVEPGPDGRWSADLRPVGGPVLGPFDRRSAALAAELAWLEAHWLAAPILSRRRPCPFVRHVTRSRPDRPHSPRAVVRRACRLVGPRRALTRGARP